MKTFIERILPKERDWRKETKRKGKHACGGQGKRQSNTCFKSKSCLAALLTLFLSCVFLGLHFFLLVFVFVVDFDVNFVVYMWDWYDFTTTNSSTNASYIINYNCDDANKQEEVARQFDPLWRKIFYLFNHMKRNYKPLKLLDATYEIISFIKYNNCC